MKKMYGVLAITAVALTLASPAFAQQISDSIDNVRNNLTTVPILINFAAYIIGFALCVAGIAKLKAHVDNPGQTPIKDGLGRLAAGAMFISVPFLLDILRNTQKVTGGSAAYAKVSALAP
jgi:hypothetical protein